jgi:hypothetical protein
MYQDQKYRKVVEIKSVKFGLKMEIEFSRRYPRIKAEKTVWTQTGNPNPKSLSQEPWVSLTPP